MITFEIIRFKNFLGSGNAFTEIELNKNKSVLILGKNGSGKSTFIDAIHFALFGTAFRKIKKEGIINTVNQKATLVEIEFSTNGKAYKIVRGIKPNKFEIWCEGVQLDQKSNARDSQTFLEQHILKMNAKSFTQIVILGSRSFVPFMKLTAGDRRIIIEDLLDIQIFSVMNSVAKQKLKHVKHELEIEHHNLNAQREIQNLASGTLKRLEADNKEKIAELEVEAKKQRLQVIDFKGEISRISRLIDDLEGFIGNDTKLQENRQKLAIFHSKATDIIAKSGDEIEFYDGHDECPTCQQRIDENFKRNKKNTLEATIAEHRAKVAEVESAQNKIKKKLDEIKKNQSELDKHNQDMLGFKHNLRTVTSKLQETEDAIKALSVEKDGSAIADSREKAGTAASRIKSISDTIDKLNDDKEYLEAITGMLKDDGIKSRIIKKYLPIINKQINKYLSDMNFFVNFNIDENFDETIKARHLDTFSYHNFSEGERMRIDLSLLFTWRAIAKMKNSVNTNLLILDEIFDSSLDTDGTDEFMNIVNVLNQEAKTNTLIISHKGEQLADKFERVIRFKKVKGYSQMTGET